MRLLLLISLAALSFSAFGEALSIPDEPAFTVAPPFPAAQLPAGRICKPIAPEWRVQSLDGDWKFKSVPFVKGRELLNDQGMEKGFFKPETPVGDWEVMPVPVCWYLFPKRDNSIGKIGYYRRSFQVTREDLAGGRLIVDFRRVGDRADVWINGKSAGKTHIGRSDSFQHDITELVKTGENEIAVRVYDYLGHKDYPRRHIGGIYESVRLLAVPGKFYVSRAMITPDLDDNSIGVRFQAVAPGALRGLTAEVINWKDGKTVVSRKFENFEIKSGTNWLDLDKITIPSPRMWSTEDPHLYVLRFRDASGAVAGYERFGFREFRAEGEWLMLNRKKFKPRMFGFSTWTVADINNNVNHTTERVLRLMKDKLHVNMIRSHSKHGTPQENLYNICDEIGMMVYFDWTGTSSFEAYDKKWKDSGLESAPELENFIRDNYSRPSIAMISFGNEIYEGHNGIFHSKSLDKLYGMVRELDLQQRPLCGSAGRYTLGAIQAGKLKERTDVLDDHQYLGSSCGSWQENIAYINSYAEVAAAYYGRPMPKIDTEYGVPGDCARYRGEMTVKNIVNVLKMPRQTPEFKEAYANMLRSKVSMVGNFLRYKLNYATPDDYADKNAIYRKYAAPYVQRPLEIYRRAGLKCLGGHLNAPWQDLFRDFPDGYKAADVPTTPIAEWRIMPLYHQIVRGYNPTLVSAGVFNQQPYAGKTIPVEVFVTNDLNESGSFKVIPQLRLADGRTTVYPAMEFGEIQEMDQQCRIFNWAAPEGAAIERGKLEFYLFKNGNRAGDNYYSVTIFPARRVALPVKCALYDSAGVRFRGLSKNPATQDTLKKLGGKFELINNFDNLEQYTHLILGGNSFDGKVVEAGEAIHQWVEKGGKLLMLEQTLCGKIPFLSNYSVVSGNPGTMVTLVDSSHPVFKSLRQEDMDSWSGDLGRMAQCGIGPMDAGMVAILPMAAPVDPDSAKSVLCDVKLGKGQILLSQIAASNRVRESGAAGEYLCSLLEYFADAKESAYSMELPNATSDKVLYIEEKDAMFIDLSKAVNRSFSDEQAGDQKGGWTDYGSAADFRNIPAGTSRLQGGILFKILDPAANGGKSCIVLRGKSRQYFPEKAVGIPVNALLNSLYVLHTAIEARNPEIAVRYVLRYADGRTHEFAADTRYDLPDWWRGMDKRNAKVVFRDGNRSLYMSEFINPRPNEMIASLDIISEGKAIPVVVAITGRLRSASVISGVGEK